MSSLRQIEANRLNAQKSTGPRTAAGKAASALNALKSGIDAKSNIIRNEEPAALQALADTYYDELQPVTAEEFLQVDILIRNNWQLRRLERVDSELWEYRFASYRTPLPGGELGRAYDAQAFGRLQRRKNEIQRSTILARQELRKLQAEREAAPPLEPIETTEDSPTPRTHSASLRNEANSRRRTRSSRLRNKANSGPGTGRSPLRNLQHLSRHAPQLGAPPSQEAVIKLPSPALHRHPSVVNTRAASMHNPLPETPPPPPLTSLQWSLRIRSRQHRVEALNQ
jgi:hypothetical protein